MVQIERHDDRVDLTMFDPEDNEGKSVTNAFEFIATGVFLEHLADTYGPGQVTFSHRTTLPGDTTARFGVKSVALEWSKDEGEFVNPRWGGLIPDKQITEEENSFLYFLSLKAQIGAEAYMREEVVGKGLVTPKKEEIYNEYVKRIAANGDKARFSLRLTKI